MDTDITDPSFKYAPSQNPIDPLNSSSATALSNTMAQQVDFVSSGSDFADNIRKQTRKIIDNQNNAMMLSMSKAAAGNAEEAAAAQRLGYETGVGAEIAARNKQLLEQRLATDRLAQLDLFKRDPVLARMLANKDFAAVAHDDLPNLMESGEQINPDLSWVEEFLIGRARGYKGTELGLTGMDMLAAKASGVPIPESLRAKAAQQSQELAALRASGGFLESFGALEGNIESTIPKQAEMALYGAVAGGLILGAPTGGIGMIPGMVAGAGMGVMSAGVVQSFQIEGGNLFVEMLDDGIPEDTALVAAPIGGAIIAALEILPLKFVTGEAKKLIKREVAGQVIDTLKQTGMLDVTKRFLQSYGIGVTTEVGTELAQDAVGIYVQEMAMLATDPLYEEKWKSEKGRAELAKQFVDTFIEVGQGMAIMGAFLPGANFIGNARRARKAKATRQFFKNIDKNASESKLKERNPRSYQEWFEEKARGTANHTLFIDIEKLREAMAKNNVSAEQLETILPGVTKAIADAKGMNGIDFAFPTSVYAARLSDIAFGQALQEHMRFDPNDMSIAENNQYVKEREQIVEEMKKSAMELMKVDAAIDQSAQAVADSVTAQLVATGRYTESESRSMSSVASAVATVMSARFNMTPLDWHNKYGSKVIGEGQAVPAAPRQVATALSVVASDKVRAKAAEFGISESQISEAETLASSIADSDWIGLAFADEGTQAEGLARAQQDIAVREKYKDKASSIITGQVMPQNASAKVDERITTKSLEQALAEIEKVFEENRKSVGVRFVSIGLGNDRATVTLQVQLLSETQIREELANRKKAAKQVQAAPLEQASRIDADYMAAVESGDVVEQQRMVDDAAKAAGYTSPIVHHGSIAKGVTQFNVDKSIEVEGGIFFTTNEDVAAQYTFERAYGDIISDEPLGDVTTAKLRMTKPYEYQAKGKVVDAIEMQRAVNFAKSNGYDGVIIRNIDDSIGMTGDMGDVYVVFNGNQIKSADPITRDAAGNVIPLSSRFNIASTSILEQAAYRGQHTAPTNDGYAQPLSNLGGIFPNDIYSQDAARLYGTGNEQQDRQAISIIQSARNKPNQSIKIYRAVPLVLSNADKIADIEKQKAEIQRRGYERWVKKQENPLTYDQLNAELDRLKSLPEEAAVVKPQINDGDWVTISKQYAVEHGESALNGNYKIVTKTVPVKHLFTDGNSIQEWGYDSTAQGILEQAVVSATTYSALDKAVGNVAAKSLAAAGWKEQIKGWVNKGIVKQSEVEWSGLVEYLDMQEGKITKETVSEFLKNNGVKVETVTLGDRADMAKIASLEGIAEAQSALTELYNTDTVLKAEFETYRKLVEADAPRDQLAEARIPIDERLENEFGTDLDEYIRDAYESSAAETKYSRYVLPGGENYRKVLVTLPVDQKARNAAQAKYNELTDAGMSLMEAKEQAQKSLPQEFRSSHWDESNVLVHLRMNDRTDADGKRVLFVEEVQSDWGQEGKKKGFAANPITIRASEARMEELKKQIIDITRQQSQLEVDSEEWNILEVKSESLAQNYDDIYRRVNKLKKKAISQAPFVETTEGWLNLGLKHVMLEAVNGGYDRVAFVTGAQSAERYDLSKQVSQIRYHDNYSKGSTNIGMLLASDINGNPVVAQKIDDPNELEQYVGKEVAKRLLEAPSSTGEWAGMETRKRELNGVDLKVGGEGMNDFYDKIVPAAMNKLLKKYGGEKLGIAKINMSGDASSNAEQPWNTDVVRKAIARGAEIYAVDKNGQESLIRNETDLQELLDSLDGDLTRGFIYGDVGGFDTQPSFDVTAAFIERVGQGLPLFQAMPSGPPRASIDLITFITTLNTAADLSSYLHEMAHFYMVTYINIANEPGAPPQITADLQIIFNWLGIKDLAAWNAMTFEEQRKYWESFAYNHEIYLFEGKSPSVEMQGVFDRFSAWLRAIYKNIRDELNAIYRKKFGEDLPMLTPEIRGVMDRMLATEKQIKYAESVNNMTPLFLTQEQSGYDDARWAAYQAMVQEAHDQSVTDLTKASLRQMEWLSNARTRLLKEMQAKHDDIRDKMRSDIAEEVAAEPVYMAMSVLKTGKGRVANGEMVVFSDKYKLNLAIVKSMIPAENLSKLGYGKFGMLSEDGLHPDMVAEMFGFKSGDELVLALLAAKPVKEEVDSRLDARMLAEYGDMNTPAEMEVQVQKALHNEARERFIGVEARFVASATRPVRAITDAARLAANTIVNAQKIENIRPSNYAAAEARAARDAADAYKQRQSPEQARKTSYTRSYNEQIAAGVDEATAVAEATKKGDQAATAAKDRQDAFAAKYGNREPAQVVIRAKQAQVVQNQLVKVSTAALEEVDKALKDFRRFFKADEKIAKNRNMDLVDAARSILAFYGLGKHDKLPSAYTDKLQAYNPEMYEAVKPIIEMSQRVGAGGNYETLTVSEFRMMREVVDALWMQSRRDKQAEIAGKMVSVAQIQGELIVRTEEIGIPKEALGLKQALTENQKRIQELMSTGAVLQRVENWARRFDGPQKPGIVGPATKYIWRPVKNAVTEYKIARNKYVKKYKELLDKVDLPVGKIRSNELDYTFGVGNGGNGKAELLGALMHMGNLSNLRKLLLGRGWGLLNEDGTLDTSRWDAFVERMINEGKLTKEDFEFLQATWDLLEEIKPIAQKAHRDLYGYYFNEIEAQSFTNRFGTYRGGYVPAKTDAMIVRDAQRQAKMEELEADFRASMPSTGMGFTMGRVEYDKPLSMDARLIAGHIDSVLRFAHIQPAIKDVLKIIGKGKFADNLTAIQPFAIDGILLPWLNRTARQTTSVPGLIKWVDKSWNIIRKRTGISIMMGGVRNAMQQFTGLFPAALLVNKGELKNAASTYFRNPMKTAANVASLSPFMNDFMNSQIFVLQDQMNELLLNPSKYQRFKDWTDHHAYFLQTANQNIVNIVTWLGKYNQLLTEIGTDMTDEEAQYEAVQQADAAVRLTQGGMSPEDVARFQVSTPFINSMTQFMGFFNMTANLNADEFVMVFRDMGWRGNKGKLMMIYILGIALPALVSDAISRSLGQGWDDDDDGYLDDVADWFFGGQARYVAGFVPFGSTALTAMTSGFNDKTYDDRITSSPSIASLEASTIGVGKAVVNIASDDKELTGRNVRDVLTLITNVTGVPVSVLGRPIGYQVDVERGKIEPTDPIDYMRGLITGVPSAESKKK